MSSVVLPSACKWRFGSLMRLRKTDGAQRELPNRCRSSCTENYTMPLRPAPAGGNIVQAAHLSMSTALDAPKSRPDEVVSEQRQPHVGQCAYLFGTESNQPTPNSDLGAASRLDFQSAAPAR